MAGFYSRSWLSGLAVAAACAFIAAFVPEHSVYVLGAGIGAALITGLAFNLPALHDTISNLFLVLHDGISHAAARLANLVGVIFRGGDGQDTPDGGTSQRKVTGHSSMGLHCPST